MVGEVLEIKRIDGLKRDEIKFRRATNGVGLLEFTALSEYENIIHAFSTRIGGVSSGNRGSLNLSFTKEPDNREGVLENYRRMAEAMGVNLNSFVLTFQTHTTNIRVVTSKDRGKGVLRDRDYTDIDGLITNEPGVTLGTFFADCIPLYFYDKKNNCIGLSHSGWKGTANKMGERTIKAMSESFGTEAKDLIVCIGPGICGSCYQVGNELYSHFEKEFNADELSEIFSPDDEKHMKLNLLRANEIIILNTGVLKENIHISDICTCCNPDLLFSHRVLGENRGNLGAFIALREEYLCSHN